MKKFILFFIGLVIVLGIEVALFFLLPIETSIRIAGFPTIIYIFGGIYLMSSDEKENEDER